MCDLEKNKFPGFCNRLSSATQKRSGTVVFPKNQNMSISKREAAIFASVKAVLNALDEDKKKELSSLNIHDVKKIFKTDTDADIPVWNDTQLEYRGNVPLYYSMCLRFQNENRSLTYVYNGCDRTNKRKITEYLELEWNDAQTLFDFFTWIMMHNHEALREILNPYEAALDLDDMFYVWESRGNEFRFFFDLQHKTQGCLIRKYARSVAVLEDAAQGIDGVCNNSV